MKGTCICIHNYGCEFRGRFDTSFHRYCYRIIVVIARPHSVPQEQSRAGSDLKNLVRICLSSSVFTIFQYPDPWPPGRHWRVVYTVDAELSWLSRSSSPNTAQPARDKTAPGSRSRPAAAAAAARRWPGGPRACRSASSRGPASRAASTPPPTARSSPPTTPSTPATTRPADPARSGPLLSYARRRRVHSAPIRDPTRRMACVSARVCVLGRAFVRACAQLCGRRWVASPASTAAFSAAAVAATPAAAGALLTAAPAAAAVATAVAGTFSQQWLGH